MAKIDGGKIRRLREVKGLTQLYLATFVGVTTDTVSRWENKRYQTIKLANARKLAEALEIPLADILDQGEDETAGAKTDTQPSTVPQNRTPQRPMQDFIMRLGIAAGLLAIIAGGLYFFLRHRQTSQPPYAGIRITAERYLPNHCAPNQLFPVAIRIHSNSPQPISLIVKEKVPAGLTLGASRPPFTTTDQEGRSVRWLLKAGQNETRLFYLCKTPASPATEGRKFFFSGSVTVKGRPPVAITAGDSLEIAPYHWADTNRDHKISDEEILSAYDCYSETAKMGIDFDLIEEIWSANGYRWDPVRQTFTVVK